MVKYENKNSAFTLVELLVTVAIVGILASISVANFDQFKRNANNSAALSHLRMGITASQAFLASNTKLPNTVGSGVSIYKNGWTTTVSGPYTGFTHQQLLPGYVPDPKISVGLYISRTFLSKHSIIMLTSHCLGAPSTYPGYDTTYTEVYGYRDDNNHTGLTKGMLFQGNNGLGQEVVWAVDGSDCP